MIKNMSASVRQRLLNRSRSTGENFNNLLTRYGIERLLYRLSRSAHGDEFILKGANLFYVWTGELYRPTKDVDMLRFGDTDPELLCEIIRTCITSDTPDDGLRFDEDSITAQVIREEEPYSGVRVILKAYLGRARISLQLDVGTGDAVTPEAELVDYPSLLDLPKARLRAYRFETAIAEKCEAMVKLGMSNTRMKDFYDVFVLARDRVFERATLAHAIEDTFQRRGTALPTELPVAWTTAFIEDTKKREQWNAFLKKSKLQAPELDEVIAVISGFLAPIIFSENESTPREWREGKWI